MIYQGDCLEILPTLETESVDSIVTDPPYGLSFMGKDWDHGIPGVPFWVEALRVAKPGTHLLAFGGTRTFHRLAVAIEDAGWEIRDTVMWVYGSGFPKSHDVSKGIDKAAGAERTEGYERPDFVARSNKTPQRQSQVICGEKGIYTLPATTAARQWEGWGTALKPAWEPIIVARKPLEGTVAANVLKYGTGAINIDGCRITFPDNDDALEKGIKRAETPRADIKGGRLCDYGGRTEIIASGMTIKGRWPANLIHDGSKEVMGLFPNTGLSAGGRAGHTAAYQGGFKQEYYGDMHPGFGDSGSAARFFYCAKASKQDRDEGCGELGEKPRKAYSGPVTSDPRMSREQQRLPVRNNHPTVKPTDLMRYLCRLVTPPGGVILDPFMGSGSTGKAAMLEGFEFIGIELNPEYVAIAERRIYSVAPLFAEVSKKRVGERG